MLLRGLGLLLLAVLIVAVILVAVLAPLWAAALVALVVVAIVMRFIRSARTPTELTWPDWADPVQVTGHDLGTDDDLFDRFVAGKVDMRGQTISHPYPGPGDRFNYPDLSIVD